MHNDSNKTVIFCSSDDFRLPSATQFRFLAFARGLTECGISVHWFLLATPIDQSISQDPCYQMINFHNIGKAGNLLLKHKFVMYVYRLILPLSLWSRLVLITRTCNGTSFFTTGVRFPDLLVRIVLCKIIGIRLLHEMTEFPLLYSQTLRGSINNWLYLHIMVPKLDHIFVISSHLKKYYIDHLQRINCATPVSLLRMIVEPDRYYVPETVKAAFQKSIVYIGTMYGDKDGVYDLVAAFSLIMDMFPDTNLLLVGDTSDKLKMTMITRAISMLRDPSRVILTGKLQRQEVVMLINKATCLALSRPDNIQAKYGFPTKLGEYLATGRPVVITSVGDVPLYLRDGENAYVAEPDNIHSFASKLQECLCDPEKANVIGRAGQLLANDIFGYRAVVAAIVDSLQ